MKYYVHINSSRWVEVTATDADAALLGAYKTARQQHGMTGELQLHAYRSPPTPTTRPRPVREARITKLVRIHAQDVGQAFGSCAVIRSAEGGDTPIYHTGLVGYGMAAGVARAYAEDQGYRVLGGAS